MEYLGEQPPDVQNPTCPCCIPCNRIVVGFQSGYKIFKNRFSVFVHQKAENRDREELRGKDTTGLYARHNVVGGKSCASLGPLTVPPEGTASRFSAGSPQTSGLVNAHSRLFDNVILVLEQKSYPTTGLEEMLQIYPQKIRLRRSKGGALINF